MYDGLPAFLKADAVSSKAVVQIEGYGMKMKVEDFTQEANRHGPLHRLLQRYTQALLMQVSQSAACNRFHSVEERFCRWILMTHDCIRSDSFPLTQLALLSCGIGASLVAVGVCFWSNISTLELVPDCDARRISHAFPPQQMGRARQWQVLVA